MRSFPCTASFCPLLAFLKIAHNSAVRFCNSLTKKPISVQRMGMLDNCLKSKSLG